MPRTVLIVDDHAEFRASARIMLEAEGYAVVGEAANAWHAMAETERLRPEVVLLDIQLPDLDGFTVATRIAATPEPPIVVLISSREQDAYGGRVAAAPVRAFIHKPDLTGESLDEALAADRS
jgi:DNA-binding NarL/FixJ family response regulator